MSVAIETVAFGDESKRLLLGNAHWAATISAGTSWNRMRVAARVALDDTGSNLTSSPQLYLGLLAGPSAGLTNGPLNSGTSHFIGAMPEDATWTRLPGGGGGPSYQANGQWMGKKVGATRTLAGASLDNRISNDPALYRMILHVEIEKGSPNFTIRTAGFSVVPSDHSELLLISSLEASTMTGANALISGYTDASTTLAVDEASDGYFNSICVGWNRSSTKLHVSEMYYAIYS